MLAEDGRPAEGQKAFNTKKGSIPARTDAVPADYPAYQQAAMADWKIADPGAVLRPRLGLLAGLAGCGQLGASGKFSTDGDAAALQKALVAAAAAVRQEVSSPPDPGRGG